jgi:hypothetical protein
MPFSGFQDLDPRFAQSLQDLIAAQPGISPFSGFRSIERQRQLWEASDKSGHMVARPGHSQHNFGRAVDLRFTDDAAREFAHANAAKYGLTFPMSYEPWHVEPIGARSGRAGPLAAPGVASTASATDAGTFPGFDIFGGRVPASGLYDAGTGAQPMMPQTPEGWFGAMISGRNPLKQMFYSKILGMLA